MMTTFTNQQFVDAADRAIAAVEAEPGPFTALQVLKIQFNAHQLAADLGAGEVLGPDADVTAYLPPALWDAYARVKATVDANRDDIGLAFTLADLLGDPTLPVGVY